MDDHWVAEMIRVFQHLRLAQRLLTPGLYPASPVEVEKARLHVEAAGDAVKALLPGKRREDDGV